ncbi:MAG: hypothetical protein ACYC49_17520 [Ignavibacteriaceae bacterium]
MTNDKAVETAKKWLKQRPMPQELTPTDVWDVLSGLGFESKGKNSDHTTFRWQHVHLLKDEQYFKFGILSVSVGHAQGQKKVVRVDSIKKLIRALNIYFENENK